MTDAPSVDFFHNEEWHVSTGFPRDENVSFLRFRLEFDTGKFSMAVNDDNFYLVTRLSRENSALVRPYICFLDRDEWTVELSHEKDVK